MVMSFPLDLGTVLPLDLVVPRAPAEGSERGNVLPGTLLYSIMLAPKEAALRPPPARVTLVRRRVVKPDTAAPGYRDPGAA